MKRASAFTLLEMTLALAASTIILAAIFGIFSKAIHMRDDATARVRAARLKTRAVNVLRNDLANARVSAITDPAASTTTSIFANSLEGSQQSHGGSFPGYLKFTTTTQADDSDGPSADVQKVEYYIVNDPDAQDRKTGLLVRTTNRDLLATTVPQLPEESLLSGVVSMEVFFYDGTEWKNSWAIPDTDQALPQAVRVRLQMADAMPIEVQVPWTTQLLEK
jgi:type II secretion system protein J